MAAGYTVTPQPQVGQQGPAWLRWFDRYAQAHAAAVAQLAVRDFPPMVREHITQEADGETATPSTMQLVVTLLARLGAAHGLRRVPFTLEDSAALTQALVLEHALTTLRTDALIGAFQVDDPQTGRASLLGAALTQWLDVVLRRAVGTAAQVPKAKRHDHLPGEKGYFNAAALQAGEGPLFVCEGAFDALALLAAGVPRVVAIYGVQGWRWAWVRTVRELVFALDADTTGQQQWRVLAVGGGLTAGAEMQYDGIRG